MKDAETIKELDMKCWCGGRVGAKLGPDPQIICLDSVNHDPEATGDREVVEILYVAGPMSNRPDNNYPEFIRVDGLLVDADYVVVNPVNVNPPGRVHYVDLIREDLRVMLDCHGVALLDEWWTSPGAVREITIAAALKMPIRPWQEWVKLVEARLAP